MKAFLCVLLLSGRAGAVELTGAPTPLEQAASPLQSPTALPRASVPPPLAVPDTPQAELGAVLSETVKAEQTPLAAAAEARSSGETATASADEGFRLLQSAGLNLPHAVPTASVEAITPRILHLNFKEHPHLANTFMRFQEHYESPRFRGKVFSRDAFAQWYASTHDGKFSYVDDWGGFNIPSRVLRRFYEGEFDPLDANERAFLDLFRGKKGRFYIIGTSADPDGDTLRHETAHGLFYTVPAYKREVLSVLKKLDLAEVFSFLGRDHGYHKSVWLDEAHAYIGGDLKLLRREGIDVEPLRAARRKLRALFRKYLAKARR